MNDFTSFLNLIRKNNWGIQKYVDFVNDFTRYWSFRSFAPRKQASILKFMCLFQICAAAAGAFSLNFLTNAHCRVLFDCLGAYCKLQKALSIEVIAISIPEKMNTWNISQKFVRCCCKFLTISNHWEKIGQVNRLHNDNQKFLNTLLYDSKIFGNKRSAYETLYYKLANLLQIARYGHCTLRSVVNHVIVWDRNQG